MSDSPNVNDDLNPPAPGSGDGDKPWFESLGDIGEENTNYLKGREFPDVKALIDEHRNLVKLKGVPPNQLLRLPENMNDPVAMAEVYKRLGTPEKPDGYTELPDLDGDSDMKIMPAFREQAHKLGLNPAQAKGLAEWYGATMREMQEKLGTENDANRVAEDEAGKVNLQKAWGGQYQANAGIAKRAAAMYELSGDDIDGLQSALGFERTMRLLHRIGEGLKEPATPNDPPSDGIGPMSPERAATEIKRVQNNPELRAKYLSGQDKELQQRMERLFQIAEGVSPS